MAAAREGLKWGGLKLGACRGRLNRVPPDDEKREVREALCPAPFEIFGHQEVFA